MALVIQIDNKLTVKDGTDTVSSLNNSDTKTLFTNHQRTKETFAASATDVALDFGGVTPKYIKLAANAAITLTVGTQVLTSVTDFEFQGTVPAMLVTNTDTVNPVVVDFVVAE